MDIELMEIRDFLADHHPFDQLTEKALSELPAKLQIRYFRRDAAVPDTGRLPDHLYLIRTGAVELRGADGELLARLGEGDLFGYRASHIDEHSEIQGIAIEDTLVYQLAAGELDRMCSQNSQFAFFFGSAKKGRLRDAISFTAQADQNQINIMTTPIRELLRRRPISIPASASIMETARVMSEERVSSILICGGERLLGIVTDRDLRSRVVAKGLDHNLPVSQIMTETPSTLDSSDFAFEAQLHMARYNIHHLPVMDGDRVAGMLTATDLAKHQTTSAVYLVSDIYKQKSIQRMREVSAKIPELLVSLAAADATAMSAGHIITSITDAITTRLLQLAEEQLGPPPVPYAWVAAGSQAREEQTAKSDQDNCLVLDDAYDPARHGEYFKALATFVCDGLDSCGYIYCPGEMMAITDQWRQPLRTWKNYFSKWIDQPEPKALMLTCVFFDLRCIYGDQQLFRQLREHMLNKTRGNRIFLALMAGNALSHQPPLGFFRNFVLIKGGEHDHTFDLKHNGIVPIVDLARVYTLAAGSDAVNTLDRLDLVVSGGEISRDGAHDLHDALEFISDLRIQHQARQIRAGGKADNFMSPEALSHFERSHLKDAFSVVRTMQNVLQQRYQR
ncbi:MAG: signal transduction protein [Candidatus Sedimenticola endophacoides]|uniref:Signal transduction protein n=2 Tax=Candidatus Sedimenticola endophacoides TaxID=2548426 RepID=A0A6N4E3L1_9GAMM|nr:MAG: signal transduction protein [Candidatus Sedimenticola endophacoides]OQX34300.1 MAG: signal transduction protein [Candidatus Sedimenticola endophacoides]OQX42053.1 MAG: signal transduction protein [Candidatus Sedimenticola endophacoides]OQX48239.1 MAG: signal transduction protein [Candidatus Sedimenticola endophacoides]PUD99984.1 MAG: signal transduction protein [Candidatus Sedimenticola endophacoides]